ncbi:MAG TPA: DinB family protein [Candidatus Deferrimicrobium sp.]|nr:DinB family protein [Candidatus Deferrimicrobium sp.]
MNEFILDQLDFVRTATLSAVEGLSDTEANAVPEGFSNNILWNLGHIYFVQERIFHFAKEPLNIPEGFAQFFGSGTKPADWVGQPPAFSEVVGLLKAQPQRIRESLQKRLNEQVAEPFKIRTLEMKTLAEVLTFMLYHEGNHAQNIKTIKRLSK